MFIRKYKYIYIYNTYINIYPYVPANKSFPSWLTQPQCLKGKLNWPLKIFPMYIFMFMFIRILICIEYNIYCMCKYIYVWIYICMNIYIYISIYEYINIYLYIYIYIYLYIYIYIYTIPVSRRKSKLTAQNSLHT
jgi:hypothetical protein